MTTFNLRTDDGLRAAAAVVERTLRNDGWTTELRKVLEWLRDTPESKWDSLHFQRRLWEENHISATGMGTIPLDPALDHAPFRRWFADRVRMPIPATGPERTRAFETLYDDLKEMLRDAGVARTPHLKIFRVLAALFPLDFTTIADRGKCREAAILLTGNGKGSTVEHHQRIRARLDAALGSVEPKNLDAIVARLQLPWMLFAQNRADDEDAGGPTSTPGSPEALRPLPAARRVQITDVAGRFQALPAPLEQIREGISREDLLESLRLQFPSYKDVTRRTFVNILRSQLGLIRDVGGKYELTVQGVALLDSQDPDVLRERFLTRILGADALILELKRRGSLDRRQIYETLRAINPGWTSQWGPGGLRHWLESLDVIATDDRGLSRLTSRGEDWADAITWVPEAKAPTPVKTPGEPESPPTSSGDAAPLERPPLATIREYVQNGGRFDNALIDALDAGLWADERRHFAILTGLSGAGKTLLACRYAEVIAPKDAAGQPRSEVIPVQPGWHDPMPLFGWVHPLKEETYERTTFLELLLRAADDPGFPYVVILDEMNLSHPEQYLAPLLSAMETGRALRLHEREETFDGVPPSIPYPSNLVIIGTVNMDETTQGLSDKVLDRAFVHEFWDIDVRSWPGWGSTGLDAAFEAKVIDTLDALGAALEEARLHFGWRTVQAVTSFLQQTQREASSLGADDALDRAIYAKILPKLRGDDSPRFRKALDECEKELEQRALVRSATKVAELRADLDHLGTARFWR